jgi:hypothetical protein
MSFGTGPSEPDAVPFVRFIDMGKPPTIASV